MLQCSCKWGKGALLSNINTMPFHLFFFKDLRLLFLQPPSSSYLTTTLSMLVYSFKFEVTLIFK